MLVSRWQLAELEERIAFSSLPYWPHQASLFQGRVSRDLVHIHPLLQASSVGRELPFVLFSSTSPGPVENSGAGGRERRQEGAVAVEGEPPLSHLTLPLVRPLISFTL